MDELDRNQQASTSQDSIFKFSWVWRVTVLVITGSFSLYYLARYTELTPAAAFLTTLTVMLGGLFFGFWAGILTGLVMVLIHYPIYFLGGGSDFETVAAGGRSIFFLVLIAVGVVSGGLRDIARWIGEGKGVKISDQDALDNLTGRSSSPEQIWLAAIEETHDLIFTLNPAGQFTSANAATFVTLGYSPEELLTMHALELIPSRDIPFISSVIKRVMEGEDIQRVAVEVIDKSGEHRIFEVRGHHLVRDGEVIGGFFIARDVDERLEVEEKLRKINESFQALVKASPLPIIIFDLQGLVRLWNPAAERTFGWKAAEVAGRGLPIIPPQAREEYQLLFDRMMDGETIQGMETLHVRRDGSTIDLSVSTAPMLDAEGRVQSIMYLAADISERKRAEKAEQEQRQLAEALRDTAIALNSTLQFDEVLDRILKNIGRVVPHDAASIMLVDEGVATIARSRGLTKDEPEAPDKLFQFAVGETPNLYQMASSGKPLLIADRQIYPWWKKGVAKIQFRAYAGVPINVKGETVGFLNLDSHQAGFYTNDHAERLKVFADQAAIAIENANLFGKVQRYAQRMAVLNEITRIALSAPDLEAMLQSVAERLVELFEAQGAYVTLWDEVKDTSIFKVATQALGEAYRDLRFGSGESTIHESILTQGKVFVIEDTASSRFAGPTTSNAFPNNAFLGLALIADDRKLGAALIIFDRSRSFKEDEIAVAEQAANQVALGISKMQLLVAEKENSTKLARANDFITALSHVAASIESAADLDQVVLTVGTELRQLGVFCLIALRDPESGSFVIRYTSLDPKAVKMIEEMLGSSINEYQITEDKIAFFKDVIEQRHPKYVLNPLEIVQQALPHLPTRELNFILRSTKEMKVARSFFLPLTVEEKVIGILWMWGSQLEEDDLPATALFASQVAIAIENARLYGEVQQLAITDPVTEVYNRRGLYMLGEREIVRAHRYGRSFSTIMLDLDNFKAVNDIHGHFTGDLVLRGIAELLRREIRHIDIIGRFGGDEFVILLPEKDLKEAQAVARRLRERLKKTPIVTERGEFFVTASAGVAEVTDETKDLARLIEKADKAMLAAKGRNRLSGDNKSETASVNL